MSCRRKQETSKSFKMNPCQKGQRMLVPTHTHTHSNIHTQSQAHTQNLDGQSQSAMSVMTWQQKGLHPELGDNTATP